MSALERRLERLEAGAGKDAASRWEVPIGTRVYLKMVERYRSRVAGQEVPPYAQEEIEEMRRHDQEIEEWWHRMRWERHGIPR